MKTGIGSHQSARMLNDEWLTPRYIINALGPFDLDPCSPIVRPWHTAKKHFTVEDNGLLQDWSGYGLVWCNPPYGVQTTTWLARMAMHNNGIALIFARTETDMFFRNVWNAATSLLFIKGRLYFCDVTGKEADANAGAPSVLVAYGPEADKRIKQASICVVQGKYIKL